MGTLLDIPIGGARRYSYAGYCAPGTYKVKITVGEDVIWKSYKIKKKSVKGMFRLTATKWLYTGKNIKPEFTWKSQRNDLYSQILNTKLETETAPRVYWDKNWNPSKNYDDLWTPISGGIKFFANVKYQKSKKPGTYKVTITGKGDYTGKQTFKYSIVTVKQVKAACHKYIGYKKLMSKKVFEKRVKEFCSYSCYCDGAEWGYKTEVLGGRACQGFVGDFCEFLGLSSKGGTTKQKDIREGDVLFYATHMSICIGTQGKYVFSLGGNECSHVNVGPDLKGSFPNYQGAQNTVKK